MSYPDITMIRSICDILDISEHELLTASEDTEARTVQRLARRYLRLLRNYRLAWYLLYGCVTLACFLGDLLSDGAVSWFWIVAAAELMCASLTLLPALVERYKLSAVTGAFTASLLLLLLICDLQTGGGWFGLTAVTVVGALLLFLLPLLLRDLPLPDFWKERKATLYLAVETAMLLLALLAVSVSPAADFWRLALPIAAVCLLLPWGLLAALRYLPAGRWCRAGAAFLWLAAYTWVFPWGIERLLLLCGEEVWPLHSFGPRPDFADWQDPYLVAQNVEALVVLAFLLLAAVCFAVAWRRRKKAEAGLHRPCGAEKRVSGAAPDTLFFTKKERKTLCSQHIGRGVEACYNGCNLRAEGGTFSMKTLRKLLAGLLLAAMVLPSAVWAAPAGLDNFQPGEDYPAGKFTDVPASSWYAENVEAAYELGLVRGVTDTTFEPESTITVAETLALAARLHSIYHTGEATFTQGSPWYQVYVDYAVENGIITANSYSNYNAAATRSQFAAILAKALPEEALEAVNTVEDGAIPDVPEGAANYDAIYQLYRAGILTGNDAAGTFTPNNTIVRSEVAALVTRMADPDLRKTITLEDESADIKVTLNRTSLTLTDNKDAYQLTATVRPSTSMAVIWSSSNPNVASVNVRGYVIAGDVGTAVITATVGDATASCTVTVTEYYRIGVSPTDLSLEVGETDTLRYSYYPDDYTPSASDKVTWSSSDPSVATVDSSGKVTAISKGKAEITVTDSNGTVSSPCSVNVYTYEPAFTTPEMNYNYGPMTLVDRSHGGGVMQVVHLDRVEFTRVQAWDFYTVQELFITIEGENFCFGRNGITMRIHFYDASGNLLDTGYLSYTGDWDSTFSEEVSIGGFSVDDLEEVARVEFTNDSSNGEVLSGIVPVDELVSEPEPEPEPEDSMSPEMQEAVGIHNELEPLLYEGAFEHFQPVEDAMGGTVFKADRADILPGCADALENCLTDAEDMVAACGSSTYWADFKATAEEYADTIAEAIEVFRRVGGTDVASITEADEDEVQRLREDVPTLWGELAAEFTDFANTHIDEIRAYQG